MPLLKKISVFSPIPSIEALLGKIISLEIKNLPAGKIKVSPLAANVFTRFCRVVLLSVLPSPTKPVALGVAVLVGGVVGTGVGVTTGAGAGSVVVVPVVVDLAATG